MTDIIKYFNELTKEDSELRTSFYENCETDFYNKNRKPKHNKARRLRFEAKQKKNRK